MDPDELVRRARAMCPLPASAQRVLELSSSVNASLPQVANAVALDPVLAIEVLRIVNSAAYARSRRVTDLAEAVLVLGLAELHDIALAMSMLAAFDSPHPRAPELQSMAVVRGAVMRCVSRVVGADARSAYALGVLADIGALACLAVDTEGYDAILEASRYDEAQRTFLEKARYGTTSRVIGLELFRLNKLPELFTSTIGFADERGDAPLPVRVLRFARRVVFALCATQGDHAAFLVALREAIAQADLPTEASRVEEAALHACSAAFDALRNS